MSLICPKCHIENRDQAKRCRACNEDLTRCGHAGASPSVASRVCPAGRHPMDPAWQTCHYCEAEQKAREPASKPPSPAAVAVVPPSPVAVSPPVPSSMPPAEVAPAASSPPRRHTVFAAAGAVPSPPPLSLPSPLPSPSSPPIAIPGELAEQRKPAPVVVPADQRPRRKTSFASAMDPRAGGVVQDAQSPSFSPSAPLPVPLPTDAAPEGPSSEPMPAPLPSSAGAGAPASIRRIVAVLVTYSWHPDGELFPVREGRNFLGSDPACDICVATDGHLSSRHATLVYRGRDFWIDDEKSMNGTFVDGESVEEKRRLAHGARILTGGTEWLFQRFDDQSSSS